MNLTFCVSIVLTYLTLIKGYRFNLRKYEDKLSPKQSVTKLNSCNELDRGSTVLCMFTFDCMRANGKPIGVCMDRSFVKSCCRLPFIPTTEATTRKTSVEQTVSAKETIITTIATNNVTEALTPSPSTECVNCANDSLNETKTTQRSEETPEETTKPVTVKDTLLTTLSSSQPVKTTTVKMDTTEKSNFAGQPEETSTFIEIVTNDQVTSNSPTEVITTLQNNKKASTTTEKLTTISEKPTTITEPPTTQPTSTEHITIVSRNTTASVTTVSNSTQSHEIPDVTTIFPSTPNSTVNSTQKPIGIKSICGRRLMGPRARIVGGNRSQFLEWPWMVSLRQWKKHSFLHKCGAALLNEYWVITAAHCVENVGPTSLLLRLGEYDVSHDREPYPHIDRRVLIIAPHPQFDPRTFEYDLALLRFNEPVNFRRNIIPVCIPSGNKSYVDQSATVAGWGRLYEDGPLPDTLQHVDVPVITNKACEQMYRQAGYIEDIPNIFLCAGLAKGAKDSCEGDSGGPLVIEEDGQFNLIGIISWGIGCALPNQPGVYTRITEFSNWIHQIIGF